MNYNQLCTKLNETFQKHIIGSFCRVDMHKIHELLIKIKSLKERNVKKRTAVETNR